MHENWISFCAVEGIAQMTAPHPGSPASADFALAGVEEGRHNISPGHKRLLRNYYCDFWSGTK